MNTAVGPTIRYCDCRYLCKLKPEIQSGIFLVHKMAAAESLADPECASTTS